MSAPVTSSPSTLRGDARDDGKIAPAMGTANARHYNSTTYSNYLFGRAGESDKPLWSDTFRGRAAIRLISRGVVGALAMTLVDRQARKQLFDYHPDTAKFGNGIWHDVALGIDKTITRALRGTLQSGAKLLGGMEAGAAAEYAQHATTFRHKMYNFSDVGKDVGRSLGAEMVSVTAGFFAASLGDATARNLIQLADPNSVKSWMVNDQGEVAKPDEKKHFSFGKWVDATARTSWRIVTKNAGEDWAVALPYVYQMRWQRGLMSKIWPDVKPGLDNGMNGGSLYYNKQGQIIGDFQAAGALDFHARFVGYNWYTLMYREAYDAVGHMLGSKDKGLVSQTVEALKHPLDTIGFGARYVVKSFIKANLYMNPAVVPFWAVRVSQSKWRATPTLQGQLPEQNAFGTSVPHVALVTKPDRDGGMQHPYPLLNKVMQDGGIHGPTPAATTYFGTSAQANTQQFSQPGWVFSADAMKQQIKANTAAGLFSAAINPFGWASYKIGNVGTKLVDRMPGQSLLNNFLTRTSTGNITNMPWEREQFVRQFFDNSTAYTPYMIAKAETALRVDERSPDGGLGAMDKAIYKLIDSTARFDIRGMSHAVSEIKRNAFNTDRVLKMREGDDPLAERLRKEQEQPSSVVAAAQGTHQGKAMHAGREAPAAYTLH